MSDEQEVKKSKKSEQTIDEAEVTKLVAIVNAAVSAAGKENATNMNDMASIIAKALIESKKPYIDPRQKANDAAARRSMISSRAKEQAAFKAAQFNCPHKKGSNPLSWYSDPNNSSFIIHRLDNNEIIGVCTNCTKVISSQLPEDQPFFRDSRGTNIRSAAGDRVFSDPLKVQRDRLNLDAKEIFVDEETGEVVNR